MAQKIKEFKFILEDMEQVDTTISLHELSLIRDYFEFELRQLLLKEKEEPSP